MGLAAKVNPGFANFDKPARLAVPIFILTLGGFGFIAYNLSRQCQFVGGSKSATIRFNLIPMLYWEFQREVYENSGSSQRFCIRGGMETVPTASNNEMASQVCELPTAEQFRTAGMSDVTDCTPYWPESPIGNWGRDLSPCARGLGPATDGTTTATAGSPFTCPQRCGLAHGSDINAPSANARTSHYNEKFEYVAGMTKTFFMDYYTEYSVCPQPLEYVGQALAYVVYVELLLTAIIGGLLITCGAVKARPGVAKEDASLMRVLKSAEGVQADVIKLRSDLNKLKPQMGVPAEKPNGTSTNKVTPATPPEVDESGVEIPAQSA